MAQHGMPSRPPNGFGMVVVSLVVAAVAAHAAEPRFVDGLVGRAFLVDSAAHEVSLATRGRFSPAQGTVEFWVRSQRQIGVEDFEGVLYRTIDPTSTTQGLQIIFCQKGLLVNSRGPAGWDVHRVFPVRFAPDSWHHLALTWDGVTGRFYVDGEQAGEFPMKPLTGCGPRTYLGALAGKYVSMSALDELRVSNVPLAAAEIRRDAGAGRQAQPLAEEPGRTVLLLHADELPAKAKVSLTARFDLAPAPEAHITLDPNPVDALGATDWFQGQWPTDVSMPQPQFPRFSITPVAAHETGCTIAKRFPLDADVTEPVATLSVETAAGTMPLYSGGGLAQIAYRTGNLLRLVDASPPLPRTIEAAVSSHRLLLLRLRTSGGQPCRVRLDLESELEGPSEPGRTEGPVSLIPSSLGWCGYQFVPGRNAGEVLLVASYDAPDLRELRNALDVGVRQAAAFDALWERLAAPHRIEPFLTGQETPAERNLVAAFVNRFLRNARAEGDIATPSLVEFYGPAWVGANGVWICFQPACRYALWIEPAFWANSLRTLLDRQTADGMVPQGVMPVGGIRDKTQIPNLSPVLRDYYVFTRDRAFLEYAYPRFRQWYEWLLANRDPTHAGIISVGDARMSLWESLCEYRDNGTDPAEPSFADTCNPLTRTPEIAGRPERVFLPDIVACQARLAEDLAFLAGELGLAEDAARFAAEYRRVRDWANRVLWDEKTRFYYPVVRATGQKLLKRSVTAFWLLWAGIPSPTQKDALVAAMLDPQQFLTTIPLPQIALSDPSFNPRCGHWGDGYCWPMDGIAVFDGLLRYGEWERAAQLAAQYNRGVFAAVGASLQPNEYYHHSGRPAGCAEMGTAGCLPLVFQRYRRDYQAGRADAEWRRFAPPPLP